MVHMAMAVLPLMLSLIPCIYCRPSRWSAHASTLQMCGARSSPHGNRHRAATPINLLLMQWHTATSRDSDMASAQVGGGQGAPSGIRASPAWRWAQFQRCSSCARQAPRLAAPGPGRPWPPGQRGVPRPRPASPQPWPPSCRPCCTPGSPSPAPETCAGTLLHLLISHHLATRESISLCPCAWRPIWHHCASH